MTKKSRGKEIMFLKNHREGPDLVFKPGDIAKTPKKGADDLIKRGIAKEVSKIKNKDIPEWYPEETKERKHHEELKKQEETAKALARIPKQLRNKDFRFVKIAMKGKNARKKPFPNDWQNTNNYQYDDQPFLSYISNDNNFGVLCGRGDLAVIDADEPEISELVQKKLPKTFTVQTGSGGKHFYYLVPDMEKKIVLRDKDKKHYGELQFTGSQVIAPGSIHPNNKRYKILEDVPIKTISYDDIKKALDEYIQTEFEEIATWENTGEYDDIDITQIINLSRFKKHGRELQGSHPVHGSKTKSNFSVNPAKGTWHCFRCGTGGGALSLIAVLEGVIDCSDAKPGALKGDVFNQVSEIAKNKYDLDVNYENISSSTSGKVQSSQKKQSGKSNNNKKVTKSKVAVEKYELSADEQKILDAIKKNPLQNILKILESKHVGTKGERKTVLTGFVHALNSLATGGGILKIAGSSSAGKTNLANTILECFPDEWIKDVGDLSPTAIKHMEWQDEKILYIREASGGEKSTETLKLMDVGDGGFKALVTVGNPSTGFHVEEKIIPVKYIITTRAEGLFDLQLENRLYEISIDETEEQTFNVLFYKSIINAGFHKDISFNPVKEYLRSRTIFDEIRVPFDFVFLKLLKMNKIRSRRDYDKLIMLCKASAFLNQEDRPQKCEGGKKILYALPEDAHNVFLFSIESFEETVTGLPKKLRKVYDVLPNPEAEKGITYLDIAKETGMVKKTVTRYCEELDIQGYIDIDDTGRSHRIRKAQELEKQQQLFEVYSDGILLFTLTSLVLDGVDYEIPLSWYDLLRDINQDTYWDKVRHRKPIKEKNWDNDWDNNGTKIIDFYQKNHIEELLGFTNNILVGHPCRGDVAICIQPPIRRKDKKLYISANDRDTGTKSTQNKIDLFDFLIPSCPGVAVTKKRDSEGFREKFNRPLDQDFFNEYYQNNFGEDEKKIISDLIVMGVTEFVDEDELRSCVKTAMSGDKQ